MEFINQSSNNLSGGDAHWTKFQNTATKKGDYHVGGQGTQAVVSKS